MYCCWLVRLLERAEHLGVLGDLLGSVNGSGRLALISGEAGVGKSALVDVFCEVQAATGTRVLSGRCDDLFAPRPLAPLSDIAPDWPVPPDGRSVAELLAALGDEQLVERLE